MRPLSKIAVRLTRGQSMTLRGKYRLKNSPPVRLVIKRLATGALLALACPSRPKKALALYRDRWTIETLFANLKTRRFDLEATHLRQTGKLKTLVALLAIAVALAAKTGVAVKAVKTVPVKRHGRPAMSLFSVGLTSLKRLLARPDAGRDSIMFEHIIANRKLSKKGWATLLAAESSTVGIVSSCRQSVLVRPDSLFLYRTSL